MPKKPTLPCSGCGKLLWRGPGSLPAGLVRCRDCRRVDLKPCGTKAAYVRGCRCDDCRLAVAVEMREYAAQVRAKTGRGPWAQYRRDEFQSGTWIGKRRRVAIYERDGWVCQICREPVDADGSANGGLAPSLDHIVPRSLGGQDTDDNLRCAHRDCNARRGAGRDVAA